MLKKQPRRERIIAFISDCKFIQFFSYTKQVLQSSPMLSLFGDIQLNSSPITEGFRMLIRYFKTDLAQLGFTDPIPRVDLGPSELLSGTDDITDLRVLVKGKPDIRCVVKVLFDVRASSQFCFISPH
jgi:hypothetical protein